MKPLEAIQPQAVDSRGHYRFVSTLQGARYTFGNTAQTIGSGAVTIVNFDTVDYDPYACVTVGAAWKYTVARNRHGIYHVHAMVTFASNAGWESGEAAILYLYKNNSVYCRLDRVAAHTGTIIVAPAGGTDIKLAAGDYIDIRVEQDSDGDIDISASVTACWMSIHLVAQ